VAAAADVPGQLLAEGVRRFRAAYPDVDVTLCDMDVTRQLAELNQGRIDVAVIRHVRAFTRASATVLAEEELGIACTFDDPLAARATVDPRELGDGRRILWPGGLAPACQKAIVEHCLTLGFEPAEGHEMTGPVSFVEAFCAIFDRSAAALTPPIACDNGERPAQLVWRPLDGRPPVLTTSALVDPSHDWVATRNFVDALAGGTRVADAA
jgi:DNA-binding transcriptional LysR family regulator